jgi:hypothetical protein
VPQIAQDQRGLCAHLLGGRRETLLAALVKDE